MSVVEQLKSFRYVTAGSPRAHAMAVPRELPWRAVRAVNVAAMRSEEPDLHLMKNLLALLSDFAITGSSLRGASDTDVLQLLQLMQASLQFALHSQAVLKGQLVERQNDEAVRAVTGRYVERVDAKMAILVEDNKGLRGERDTLRLSADALRRSLAEQEATARTLERQLGQERERFYTTVSRQERLLQLSRPVGAGVMTPPPPPPPQQVWNGAGPCPACGRDVATAQRKKTRKGPSRGLHRDDDDSEGEGEGDSATLTEGRTTGCTSDTGSDSTQVRALRRRLRGYGGATPSGRRSRSRSRGLERQRRGADDYVDWRTFARFVTTVQRGGAEAVKQVRQATAPSPRAYDEAFDFDGEHSVPVDASLAGSSAGARRAPAPSQMRTPTAATHKDLRAMLAGAVDVLRDNIQQEMGSVARAVEATTGRLAADLATLRTAQQHQQQHQQVAAAPAQTTAPRGSDRTLSTPSSTIPVPVVPSTTAPTSASAPAPAPAPASPPVKHVYLKRRVTPSPSPSLHSLRQSAGRSPPPPADLPRARPVQKSVTPLERSRVASPVDAAVGTRAEATPPPEWAGRNFLAAAVPHTEPSAQAPATPTDHSAPVLPRAAAGVASTTGGTLTTGVSTEGHGGRPAPSLDASSLSSRGRRSLPTFDLSVIRTPPASGSDAKKAGGGGSGSGSPAPSPGSLALALAPAPSPGSPASSVLEPPPRPTVRLMEDSPASAAVRASVQMAEYPESEAGDTATETSLTTRLHGAAWGTAAATTNVSSPTDPRCEHCRQRFAAALLPSHRDTCSMRVVQCRSCGRRVVARLLARHQCDLTDVARHADEADASGSASRADSKHDTAAPALAAPHADREGHGSNNTSLASNRVGSMGPRHSSSVALMESQRELRELEAEEKAYQDSPQGKRDSALLD